MDILVETTCEKLLSSDHAEQGFNHIYNWYWQDSRANVAQPVVSYIVLLKANVAIDSVGFREEPEVSIYFQK